MIDNLKKLFSKDQIFSKKKYIEIIVDKKNIHEAINKLKESKDLYFNQLIDITAIDYPANSKRFEVIYILLSMVLNKRVIVKTFLNENEGIESITSIYFSANWYERECYDLFGINFLNHPDLRRIMTDYNFEGYPLRKDFPLTGHTEVRYDSIEKKVVYEPVKLAQEFRNFDYVSPWEGASNNLEEDETSNKGKDERD